MSVEYVGNVPKRIEAVVISTQHSPEVSTEELRREVKKHIIDAVVPSGMVDSQTKYHINPTGRFVVGGPHGDTGLTGRKIIVDTYGGMGRHGGGAFSGKDPTKVDRSACYMARYIAKNIVASKLASRCEVQLAYAIGVAEPVSVSVDTFGTGVIPDERFTELVRENFSAHAARHHRSPASCAGPSTARPRPSATSAAPKTTFTWEATDKAGALKERAGVAEAAAVK